MNTDKLVWSIIGIGIVFTAVLIYGDYRFRHRTNGEKKLPDDWRQEKFQEANRVRGEDLALSFTNEIRARRDSNGVDVLDFICSMPGTSMTATIVAPTNLLYMSPSVGYGNAMNDIHTFTQKWWMGLAAAPTNAMKVTNDFRPSDQIKFSTNGHKEMLERLEKILGHPPGSNWQAEIDAYYTNRGSNWFIKEVLRNYP